MDFKDVAKEARRKGVQCIVFTKPSCRQCVATIKWITQHGVSYAVSPLSAHWIKVAQENEIASAPVVVTSDGEAWGGFRPDRLAQI